MAEVKVWLWEVAVVSGLKGAVPVASNFHRLWQRMMLAQMLAISPTFNVEVARVMVEPLLGISIRIGGSKTIANSRRKSTSSNRVWVVFRLPRTPMPTYSSPVIGSEDQ